jgi:hypothetical protein
MNQQQQYAIEYLREENRILRALALTSFHFMSQLITIPNRCHRFPGFVYEQARFSSDHKSIEIESNVVTFGVWPSPTAATINSTITSALVIDGIFALSVRTMSAKFSAEIV